MCCSLVLVSDGVCVSLCVHVYVCVCVGGGGGGKGGDGGGGGYMSGTVRGDVKYSYVLLITL